MRVEKKKAILLLLLAGCVLSGYWIWLSLRPVKIVAVHEYRHFSDVLVRSFPPTDKGKINWWLKNKDLLKEKYDIPKPSPSGYFTVIFWDFGDGYKEEDKYDRLCFEDMKPPVNCIEKDKVFTVSYGKNMGLSFTTNNKIYRMKKSAMIVEDESD